MTTMIKRYCRCGNGQEQDDRFPLRLVYQHPLSPDQLGVAEELIFGGSDCGFVLDELVDGVQLAYVDPECLSNALECRGLGYYDFLNDAYYASHGRVISSVSGLPFALAVYVDAISLGLSGEFVLCYMSAESLSDAVSRHQKPGWWVVYSEDGFMHCTLSYEEDDGLQASYHFGNPTSAGERVPLSPFANLVWEKGHPWPGCTAPLEGHLIWRDFLRKDDWKRVRYVEAVGNSANVNMDDFC